MNKLPEIIGDVWFNSPPLKPEDLKGKVVLVDFWTYSCVNCLRTIPYLRGWWDRFRDHPFLMIGIHSPEFDFEKDPANVQQAIKDLGIEWPVVLDNEHVNWNRFSNLYWPAKYLADIDGNIVYTHFGEGGYDVTEQKIAALLAGEMLTDMKESTASTAAHGMSCFVATPELYCGYERGKLGNDAGYATDKTADYELPPELEDDSIALGGKFLATPEYVESQETGARLLLRFRAAEVNLVLKPGDDSAVVKLSLDGAEPAPGVAGQDVDPDGLVKITTPRMYNLLKSEGLIARSDLSESVLSIEAIEGGFQAFAFTFSGCEIT